MKPSKPHTEFQPIQLRKAVFRGSCVKRLLALLVVPALAACGTRVANAVTVIGGAVNNGNMDDTSISSQLLATPTGWVATSDNGDGLSSELWNNYADPGGSGVFFKTFFGDPATPFDANLYRDNPATPGMSYTLTGWVGAGPGYSGSLAGSGTLTQFGVEFLNAGNTVVGSSVLNLTPAQLNVVNGNPFDYAEYTVTAIAPAGAATVRVRFSMIDAYDIAGGGDAALVTDNYTLTAVPEPATFGLLGLGFAGLVGLRRRR